MHDAMPFRRSAALSFALLVLLAGSAVAQVGEVLDEVKISDTAGGFTAGLTDSEEFGSAIACLGDVDGDGVDDLAVGSPSNSDGGVAQGAVWILFMEASGSVKAAQMISENSGGLGLDLLPGDRFGGSLAPLGDVDGNGVPDLMVGSSGHDTVDEPDSGCVYVLRLASDGTVVSTTLYDQADGLFDDLDNKDRFGTALGVLGDLDNNGTADLLVGAPGDNDFSSPLQNRGAVWILFMGPDAVVLSVTELSEKFGGLKEALTEAGSAFDNHDRLGSSVAGIGDLDHDGREDFIVGSPGDDDAPGGGLNEGVDRGAVHIVFLNLDGTVREVTKFSEGDDFAFPGVIDDLDGFGFSVAAIGDINRDGIMDVAIGAPGDDDDPGGASPANTGAVWVVLLEEDGTVQGVQKISMLAGNYEGFLDLGDGFGSAIAATGDANGDGLLDVVVGTPFDDDGGGGVSFANRGAIWQLRLDGQVPFADPWTDLGNGLAGTGGVTPFLEGQGPLEVGTTVAVVLLDAVDGGVATLVLGLNQINAAFKGGVLVPEPLVTTGFVVPDGELIIKTEMPQSLVPGIPFYMQYWITDAGAPEGFAVSNALEALIP